GIASHENAWVAQSPFSNRLVSAGGTRRVLSGGREGVLSRSRTRRGDFAGRTRLRNQRESVERRGGIWHAPQRQRNDVRQPWSAFGDGGGDLPTRPAGAHGARGQHR